MKPNEQRMHILEPLSPLEPELRELLDAARRRDANDPADEAGCEHLLVRFEATARVNTARKAAVEEAIRRKVSWLLRPVGTMASLCVLATFAISVATREGARDAPTTSQPSPRPRVSDSSVLPMGREVAEDRLTPTHVDALPSSVEAPVQAARADLAPPRVRAPAPQTLSSAVGSTSVRPGDPSGDRLAQEIRLIESARARLTAMNPASALRLVGEHERRFPDGQLAQQREWIRIQALGETGNVTEARERTEQFRQRFPGGLLLPSVERTLDAAP